MTPTPEELRLQLTNWMRQHEADIAPFRERKHDVDAALEQDARIRALLWTDGWTRWGWPEDCGGLGGDERHRAVVVDVLAEHGLPIPESFGALEVLAQTIITFAPAIAREHLPRVLRGEALWCQGFSEPGAGSDLASVRTRATITDDGFVVSGQKIWTSYGHRADYGAVLVRTGTPESRHRGLSLLWVDMRTPGVTTRPIVASNGSDEFSELYFDNVVVPRDQLIGALDHGWDCAMYLLQYERGMWAWQRQAHMHRELAALTARGWGSVDDAAVVGRVYVMLVALRELSRRTVSRLARKEVLGPEVSIDKAHLGDTELAVADAARRLIGSPFELSDDAFAEGWRSEWLYAQEATVYGGAAEVQRNIIAERLLHMPKEPKGGQ
ncbi:acyl-CoA dehydrogenase family protein [Dactylosporangium sp. AC04546]|uniref:acyl-CoA dehydrogenase family protein n=1 Tax=Dactylosporangium sp. AC04546 TaxID=2862460 RepID=UPI001EDECFE6|nr:acyl-CoA dehydrogenase family protein [Dactylosporangium sp. AC04546]WVK86838.1 acyl-CoA dehydrogenase family protein [Dactylosporangium sp. AC04546]